MSMGGSLGAGAGGSEGAIPGAIAENSHSAGSPAAKTLPARWGLAQDDDGTVLDREVAAAHQVLHQAADHVAGGADALCDVLLSELLGDDHSPLALGGKRGEQPDEAPVDVGKRQALDVLG